MGAIKVRLCPNCTECPTVEITDEGVTIRENENVVRLTLVEWNDLVSRIRRGELRRVQVGSEPPKL